MSSIPNLGTLSLNDCGLKSLPEGLFKLKKLKILVLRNNKVEKIPSNIIELENLAKLNLLNNQLLILPKEICELKKMQSLILDNNPISSLPECLLHKPIWLSIEKTNITFTEYKIKEIRKNVKKLDIHFSQIRKH